MGGSGPTSPSGREFCRVQTSDLTVDPHSVTFSTSLKFPTLFAVGVASAPQAPKSAIPYPLLPLRCCLYVARPSDRDQYLTNTDIWVYIAMSLKTVEMVRIEVLFSLSGYTCCLSFCRQCRNMLCLMILLWKRKGLSSLVKYSRSQAHQKLQNGKCRNVGQDWYDSILSCVFISFFFSLLVSLQPSGFKSGDRSRAIIHVSSSVISIKRSFLC